MPSTGADDMIEAPRFLPYGRQQLDETDIDAVVSVLRSDWLTTGPKIEALEAALAARLKATDAVVCSNGTAALHLACLAAGLGPGDAAIVPAMTFIATANAVVMTGAEVEFADVSKDTGLMEPAHLTAAWARADARGLRVKAVLPVDLAGQCADLATIAAIAGRGGAIVIEDACHAIGGFYPAVEGKLTPIGSCSFGQMTVFSFHPVKTMTAGEGGAVLTNDPVLAARMRRLRSHGMTRDADQFESTDLAFAQNGGANPWYYEMSELGWNYRLSDIHAALALSQLERLEAFVEYRRRLAALYDHLLGPMAPLVKPIGRASACVPAWHLYPVLIDFKQAGLDRATLMAALRNAGIGSMVHYIPVNRQPYYKRRVGNLELPGADAYYQRTLSLPLFVGMTEAEVRHVVSVLKNILGESIEENCRITTYQQPINNIAVATPLMKVAMT